MVQICPKCGGAGIHCPVCNAPTLRKQTKFKTLKTSIIKLSSLVFPTEKVWEVQGIDISAWNGTMNFGITKTKCQYVYVRLGYGNNWKDGRCDTYRRDLIANDIPYGVYWYTKIGQDWQVHAESFAEVINDLPYQLDIVIDAEETSLDPINTLTWLMNFENRLKLLTGKTPMIYTSVGFWNSKVAKSNYFSGHKLWDAHWTLSQAPLIPYGWSTWRHWQWSANGNGKGPEYGSGPDGDKDMDLDRYYGTVLQFNAEYGTHIQPIVPIPPTPPIVPLKYVVITATALNMRTLPDISGIDIGTLKFGDDVPVVEDKNGWYRVEGWISKSYTRPK